MNMTPCPDCAGLIPARCDACPNCDAKPSLARKVTAAAAAGATAMTLMACYGAGDYGYEPQWPTSPTAACNLATPLVVDAGNAFASDRSDGGRASDAFKSPCGLNSGPERVFYYDPSEVAGLAGKVTILWDSPSDHSVFVVDRCGDGNALACGNTAFNGQLEMDVSSLAPFYIVVDSMSEFVGDDFDLQVVFEPLEAAP